MLGAIEITDAAGALLAAIQCSGPFRLADESNGEVRAPRYVNPSTQPSGRRWWRRN